VKYLITGGGTGGHIYPALAIAKEIKDKYKDAEILYVGTKEGLEAELVHREGFKFKTIRVKGMPRKLNKQSLIAIKALLEGLNDSKKILKDFKPDIVIGTGGYVCGPMVYMASKLNIKTLIHEQNAFPGITNKILSRYVDKVAITFEEAIKYFKYPDRVINTGNPIRSQILNIDKKMAYKELKLESNKPLILSFGGSGGQKKLNDVMLNFIEKNLKGNIQIIHITGSRLYDDFISEIKEKNIIISNNIQIVPYFYKMPEALNIAKLVITSAGAITLAEISAVGVASVLIPKSYTAENHQEYNAKSFEANGASKVILEKELTNELFLNTINELLENEEKLKEMGKYSMNLGKMDAAKNIINIIDGLTLN
jgi:UDP-N-acetylglucosamine--N-acetylmuramyl-(pentapeptide) pyrophosphoryl-undecaprenol N-acetylglucosamine transferase